MRKVVVFDGGWGGEVVAQYLQQELKVIEVITATDWDNLPYEEKSLSEICRLSTKYLRQFVNRVDLIVLGGFATTQALEYLQRKFPKQRFVGLQIDYRQIRQKLRHRKNIAFLMSRALKHATIEDEILTELPRADIVVPDCSGWEALVNHGMLSTEILRDELGRDFLLDVESNVEECEMDYAAQLFPNFPARLS